MEELKNKTFVFYPEFSGMSGSVVAILFLMLAGAFFIFLPEFMAAGQQRSFTDNILLYALGMISFLMAFVVFFGRKVTIESVKYFLTENKLVVERGFATKTISTLDLENVIDLELRQSAPERTFGGCTLTLYNNDVTDPVIIIKGLSIYHGRNVFKLLNYFVDLNKK
jgi:uncharacterized membrane protein YdbT with pleckstrin-like domain